MSLVVVGLAGAAAASAASPTWIFGTWSGTLQPTSGSQAQPEQLTVHVRLGEQTGTWSINSSCYGTLTLQSISNGFHHYNRIAAQGTTCATGNAGGVDCLMRTGSQVLDEYVSRRRLGEQHRAVQSRLVHRFPAPSRPRGVSRGASSERRLSQVAAPRDCAADAGFGPRRPRPPRMTAKPTSRDLGWHVAALSRAPMTNLG
jgi:hypothetical protein